MPGQAPAVLVITNQLPLGHALRVAVETATDQNTRVTSITYKESIALLTPQQFRESDLVVLELFRDYPGGQRAEGVTLAERWLHKTPFLVVSPLFLANRIRCPGYWDVAAEDSIVERIRQNLGNPRLCGENFRDFKTLFSRYLAIPSQHNG